MKWALFSDIHGNLEAIQAVAEDLRLQGAERIFFLGDGVGYGAEPNECLAVVRELTDTGVAGNHDYGAVGLTRIDTFNPAALQAILWTQDHLSMENIAYLRRLPLTRQEGEVDFVHSSPDHPEEWNYIFSLPEAEEGFRALRGNVCFIGHSHRPMVVGQEAGGKIDILRSVKVRLKEGVRYIINVGSVGQPRDGDPRASYGIYEDESREYRLRRVEYDIPGAQKKIRHAGLPPSLAQRLSKGY